MRPVKTLIVLAAVFLAQGWLGKPAFATSPFPRPFDCKFEPVELPKTAGPVTFNFEVTMTKNCLYCKNITITVEAIGGVEYFGPETYTVPAEIGDTYSGTLEINLLPNDTGLLNVYLYSKLPEYDNEFYWPIRRSFVTTGDTVEYFYGRPQPKPEPAPKTRAEMLAEVRTPERLAKVYGVRFKLRDSTQRLMYEAIVGPLPDRHSRGFYYVETTWGNILQLADSGFSFEHIPPGEDPFPPLYPPPKPKTDSTSDSMPRKPEPSAPQGSLRSPESLPGLSIEHVDGEIGVRKGR